MIRIRGLVKRRGMQTVLAGVDLEVKVGEVAVVVGPSGGGKSTLLRCINALDDFDAGQIEVGDICLEPLDSKGRSAKLDLTQLRRRVGMVFQQFHLFPHLRVIDNVLSGPIRALGQRRREAEPQAIELLRRVGLADRLYAWPHELSGGQQQRVAIARALAVNPSVILFDEPTSALDPRMASEVLAVIADLAKSGQTMIVVTHHMSFAQKVADTVYVMHAGGIAESGSPEQIFGAPQQSVTQQFLREIGQSEPA